jgi:hypothetical protein
MARPSLFDGVIVYGLLVLVALLWSVALGVVVWRHHGMIDASPGTENAAADR